MDHLNEEALCRDALQVEAAVLELDKVGLNIKTEQNALTRRKICRVRYLHVLWVHASPEELTIHYVRERQKILQPTAKVFSLQNSATSSTRLDAWVQLLLHRAYGESKSRKKLKIFLNPSSGKGTAVKLFCKYAEPLFVAAQCQVDIQETSYSGQAGELVRAHLEIDSWDAIVCCSGDGLPHEVINGLALRNDAGHILRKIPIVQLPGGSGNALCVNMFGTTSISLAALYTIKGVTHPMDLMSITQGDKRHISFLSQNLGLLAECDLDTEGIRFLGGKRFAVGLLQRLLKPPVYGCKLATYSASNQCSRDSMGDQSCDQTKEMCQHGLPDLQFGTVNDPVPDGWKLEHLETLGVFFAGKFPFVDATSKVFPSARLDGLLDILTVDAGIGARKLLQLFSKAERGTHLTMPEAQYRKVLAYRVVPSRTHGAFSVDGERFPIKPFQVEVHPQMGMTLTTPPIVG
ncbi:ATP-NAD kinase-like domain-containing protein [Aspergillus pseudocaelatus]|uniref:ATP-NAD kinase-like domain-containing protein n=1 Tax=Aspergillus pseudocaelatus TaxID=1825620 RepID=A0ABQ6X5Y0_9EURO|nr:ATP-NAD kinase-like domain-containing protein [Aspergillus pseudocaelatus]